MQLFLHTALEANDRDLLFGPEESKHLIKVLRHKSGDRITIGNTRGLEAVATIIDDNPKACSVRIDHSIEHPKPEHHIHVAIAPTKQMERLEWFVEKATELGISRITPIICDHSERKTLRLDRLEKRRNAALKQSLSFYGVDIDAVCPMEEFLNRDFSNTDCYIAYCGDDIQHHLATVSKSHQCSVVLIGPEGDFSHKEIQQAIAREFTPITLGDRRLRTETAGIAAVQILGLKSMI